MINYCLYWDDLLFSWLGGSTDSISRVTDRIYWKDLRLFQLRVLLTGPSNGATYLLTQSSVVWTVFGGFSERIYWLFVWRRGSPFISTGHIYWGDQLKESVVFHNNLLLFLLRSPKPSHITQQMPTSQPIRIKDSTDACMTWQICFMTGKTNYPSGLAQALPACLAQTAMPGATWLCHVIGQKLGDVTKMSQWRHHGL